MSAELSSFVYKILCEHQGSLNFTQLQALVRPFYTVADEVLLDVLRDRSKLVVVQGKEGKLPGSFLGPDSLLIAKTSLRLCQKLPESCNHCDCLHLCRYFVCGNCRYREKCKNPHELNSAHNMAVLSRVGLQNLQVAGLCWLLLQNDPYLLPEVCTHYNKGNGEHGSCKFKTTCIALHVCQHFLQGDCKFDATCKRAHTFDQTAMKILKGRGFNQERIVKLSTIYKNRFLITSYRETPDEAPVQQLSRKLAPISISEEDSNEICLYFIRKHCSFREKCVRVHYHLPYKWQVLGRDGKTWSDLPNIEEVEMAYCNPTNSMSQGPTPVNFDTMTRGSTPVRRLSTASSVTKPPYFILTTQWLWYWKDDQGSWVEYGHEVDGKDVTSITSQCLENVYLSDKDTNISFTIGKHDYILCCKEMFQQNIKYKTKRKIRRRPRFISAQEVQKKLQSGGPEASGISSVCVPPNWDQGALPDVSYKLVLLQNTCTEFKQMEGHFKRTMPKNSVHSIHRIQNPSLWRVFQWQKEQMQKRSGEKTVDERFLFHGTEPSLMEAICEQNFDWRICGAHGTTFGKGSYFARDAIYSDKYSKVKKEGTKIMFVALVLVGKFTRGRSEYVRPPPKGTNADFYDSCVDNETNPSIFVIFEKHQIYPQFIIEYK